MGTNEMETLMEEVEQMTETWEEEKDRLSQIKTARVDLDTARRQLELEEREGNYEKAGELKYVTIPKLEELVAAASEEEEEASDSDGLVREAVTQEDVLEVVSRSTGIPVSRLHASDRSALLAMEDKLRVRVVGQEGALSAVADAVRLSRAGLHAHTRPVGSFLFLGPTGVGKTELCKAVAEHLYDHERHITRIDMSEYMERHSVSRLIGAPPGYVGYEAGGALTESVRRRPYQLVLFDEIEKAHKEVLNVLLQLLDEGTLTDGQGRKVDFRNCLVVLTSNLGSDKISQDAQRRAAHLAGGGVEDNSDEAVAARTALVREQVLGEVRNYMPPELINRLDELIVFKSLTPETMRGVVDARVRDLKALLQDRHNLSLELDADAVEWLSEEGFDLAYGARPLRRLVQRSILNPLAAELLEGSVVPDAGTVRASVGDGDADGLRISQ